MLAQRHATNLRDVIKKASSDNPTDRYQSAADFIVALENVLQQVHFSSERPSTETPDGQLRDNDALILGMVSSLCSFPGSHTSEMQVESQLNHTLSSFSISISYRRLIRAGFIEAFRTADEQFRDEYTAIRLTDSGSAWVEAYENRVAALIGMIKPPPPVQSVYASSDDDMPF